MADHSGRSVGGLGNDLSSSSIKGFDANKLLGTNSQLELAEDYDKRLNMEGERRRRGGMKYYPFRGTRFTLRHCNPESVRVPQ